MTLILTLFYGFLALINLYFFLTNLKKAAYLYIPGLFCLCGLGVAASVLMFFVMRGYSWGDFITGLLTTQSPPQLPVVESSVE